MRGNGLAGWFGWPTDDKLEALREAWFAAPDLAAQKKIAADIQAQAYTSVPYITIGQFDRPTAYRSNLTGYVAAPLPILWSIDRK